MSPSRAPRARAAVPLVAAAVAGLAGVLAGARAEEQPAAAERLFIERVEVNVVNVEVFVTDRQGRRVDGLGREDFELRVDGEPVEIANFYAATTTGTAAEAAAGTGGLATVGLPTPAAGAADRAATAREERLNLMVYVDHAFIRPANRKRVLDHLRGFLTRGLDESTWVMLVGYNGAVQAETPLTRDPEAIAAGLDALSGYAAGAGPLSMDRVMTVLNNTPEDLGLASLLSSFMQQEEAKLRLSLQALEGSLALFAGLPGRKAVLHVSDGLPMEVMQTAQALVAARVGDRDDPVAGLRNGERLLYQRLVRAAQAHQIAFYPMDTRGPSGQDYASAEHGPLDGLTLGGAGVSNAVLAAGETIDRQEPLIEMAAATGGRAILNTYDFGRALETIAVDFGSFYSLGFAAPHAGDGRRHAIDVRVKRPGLRVRHREGYVDQPLVERVGDRTLSFLHLEMESNPLGARLGYGTPRRDGGHWIVPLLVRVPAEGVTLLPDGGARQARLHFFVAVRDDRGRVSELSHIPHPVTLPAGEEAPDGGDLGLAIHLEVRPGTWTVAVGVWDEIGGGESYLRETVEIVEPERAAEGRRGRGRR